MDARYRVVDGEAGGAIILADGPRLVVDETGCITVPGEFNGHPHLRLMAGLGLIKVEAEVEAKVEAKSKAEVKAKK